MNIVEFVKKADGVSFHDFMEHALYCPEDGYYGVGKVKIGGKGMDFITHPILTSPFFGRGLVYQLRQMWLELGKPRKFDLVEVGGGYGVLARDILSESKRMFPDFFKAIKYLMVEISPALIDKQKKTLDHFGKKVSYFQGSALDFSQTVEGAVISNELIDAMPVHRVIYQNDHFKEVYVGYKQGKFFEELRDVSLDQILSYIGNIGMKFFEGQHLCVNLKSLMFLRKISRNLTRGYVITIDYGDLAELLYGDDLSHIRVGKELFVGEYPYADVSSADITSDVDFSALIKAGERLGLRKIFYASELDFFKKWLRHKRDGAEQLFEKIIGSNYKVLIQEKLGNKLL